MTIKIEEITPEIAAEYLTRNTENYRGLNRRRVETYAKDMELGKWEFNGEGIKFNKSGKLVDGQHRLYAIIKANIPIKMLVVYDVDDDVSIYDIQQSRSLTQLARSSGLNRDICNNSLLSAANIMLAPDWRADVVPKGQVLDYVDAHADEFAEAHKISRQAASNGICRRSACIAAIYCVIRLGKYKNSLYPFFGVVNSGFPIDGRDCSPAIVLRNYLISASFEKLQFRLRTKTLFSIVCQALDDFENDRKRRNAYKPDYDLADKIRNAVIELDAI